MPVGASNMVIENKKKRYAQNDNQNKKKNRYVQYVQG